MKAVACIVKPPFAGYAAEEGLIYTNGEEIFRNFLCGVCPTLLYPTSPVRNRPGGHRLTIAARSHVPGNLGIGNRRRIVHSLTLSPQSIHHINKLAFSWGQSGMEACNSVLSLFLQLRAQHFLGIERRVSLSFYKFVCFSIARPLLLMVPCSGLASKKIKGTVAQVL